MIRRTEADVEQSRKALAAAEAGIATADATAVEAAALFDRWESESKRVAKLVQGQVIDAQTGDETRNQFRASARARQRPSKAAVVKAKADRDKAASDVLSASARVDVARADSRRLEAMRGYAQDPRPVRGRRDSSQGRHRRLRPARRRQGPSGYSPSPALDTGARRRSPSPRPTRAS